LPNVPETIFSVRLGSGANALGTIFSIRLGRGANALETIFSIRLGSGNHVIVFGKGEPVHHPGTSIQGVTLRKGITLYAY
jgi:hypothetical protein